MCILVQTKPLSTNHGGFVTSRLYDTAEYKMRIILHDKLTKAESYAVLCHEIGHILLGHLGTDADHWWPCRIGLTHDAIEVEAESVSYMVAARLGLETSSDAYLAGYTKNGQIPEGVSLDLIEKVAGRITEMGEHLLPKRKQKARNQRMIDGSAALMGDDPGAVDNLEFKYLCAGCLIESDQ